MHHAMKTYWGSGGRYQVQIKAGPFLVPPVEYRNSACRQNTAIYFQILAHWLFKIIGLYTISGVETVSLSNPRASIVLTAVQY